MNYDYNSITNKQLMKLYWDNEYRDYGYNSDMHTQCKRVLKQRGLNPEDENDYSKVMRGEADEN